MKKIILIAFTFLIFLGCQDNQQKQSIKGEESSYLDYTNCDDKLSGGVKMIPIKTSVGEFKVWTKRVGNNPTMKVL